MSYAVFFGVLSATCLVGALAALWGSLRAAFGGEGGGTISSAADAPERAALLDEKTSLLRAIKDLQYEHQVGKLDAADYERLDRAYRARAKEVLELLDRDVRPYRTRAEALLSSAVPLGSSGASVQAGQQGSKKKSKKKGAPAPASKAPAPSGEALVGKLDALSPEMRAAAEAFLAKLAEEASVGAAAAAPEADDDDADVAGSPPKADRAGASDDGAVAPDDDEDDEDDGDEDDDARPGKAGS